MQIEGERSKRNAVDANRGRKEPEMQERKRKRGARGARERQRERGAR